MPGDLSAFGNQVADKGSVIGGTVSVLSGLTLSQWGVITGMFVGVFGFLLQWYYLRRRDAREEALARDRLQEDEGGV